MLKPLKATDKGEARRQGCGGASIHRNSNPGAGLPGYWPADQESPSLEGGRPHLQDPASGGSSPRRVFLPLGPGRIFRVWWAPPAPEVIAIRAAAGSELPNPAPLQLRDGRPAPIPSSPARSRTTLEAWSWKTAAISRDSIHNHCWPGRRPWPGWQEVPLRPDLEADRSMPRQQSRPPSLGRRSFHQLLHGGGGGWLLLKLLLAWPRW